MSRGENLDGEMRRNTRGTREEHENNTRIIREEHGAEPPCFSSANPRLRGQGNVGGDWEWRRGCAPDWKSGSLEGRLSAAQTEERRRWMANGFTEKNLTPSLRADPSLLGKGEREDALAIDQGIHVACAVGIVVAEGAEHRQNPASFHIFFACGFECRVDFGKLGPCELEGRVGVLFIRPKCRLRARKAICEIVRREEPFSPPGRDCRIWRIGRARNSHSLL